MTDKREDLELEKKLTAFACGGKKDHKCDNEGPEVPIKDDDGNIVGGHLTCSICGCTALDADMWRLP